MCHCRNNEQCNDTTGECKSGCVSFWYGPGCQYRDIAEGEYSRHSDQLPLGEHKYSNLANDGDENTCSSTADIGSLEKKVKPFWRVWFPVNETIRELEIVTLNEYLHYFSNFIVYVEFLQPAEKENFYYVPMFRRECYKHGDDAPKYKSFTVLCSHPVVGNQVKIELAEIQTQLVLCDVRINGGRNLAFKRKTTQSSTHKDCNGNTDCSSGQAVDGNESNKYWKQCTFTAVERDPWWRIDLGRKITMLYIRILLNQDKRSTYQLEVSNATNEIGKLTYNVKSTTSLQMNLALNSIGEQVKLTKSTRNFRGRLQICEVYVFGDCLEDVCGYECEEESHCRQPTFWDKMSGSCSKGCKDGWMGSRCDIQQSCRGHCKDGHTACNKADDTCLNGCNDGWKGDKCDQECDDGTFGSGCGKKCSGHCKDDQPCDKDNGLCPSGCNKGYTGNYCNQNCSIGSYGVNCSGRCSPHCKGGNCSNVDGSCLSTCDTGWKGNKCEQECYDGTYGQNCSMKCSRNCKNVDPCEKVNGLCQNGCKLGFMGNNCSRICTSGKYGENCSKRCSQNCVDGNCEHEYGRCTNGCRNGWLGMHCDQHCKHGTFGKSCSKQCSEYCKHGKYKCNHVNGYCYSGCKTGWKGDICDQDCRSGFYGINCSKKCSEHCVTLGYESCSKANGSCLFGCHDGWNGHRCDRECENGWFGRGCLNKCSLNCKNGDTCDDKDGQCPKGCKPGYTGKTCKQNCTVGFYGDECKHNCSGHCEDGTEMCSYIDGHCMSRCKAGWVGTKCDFECSDGLYGANCTETCGNCKTGTVCHKVDGTCNEGCDAGYIGKNCLQAEEPAEKMVHISVGGFAAIVVTFVVLIFFSVFLSIYLTRKRLMGDQTKSENVTVTYANVLAAETNSANLNTPDLNVNVEMENTYEPLKRTTGIEHIYE